MKVRSDHRTLQIACVLYCISMPILTRKTFATLFYLTTVLCFEMVQKLYCIKQGLSYFLQFDMFISGEYIF